MWFGKNIDVTTYIDGVRKTHNPPGRAYSSVVWDYYKVVCYFWSSLLSTILILLHYFFFK